MLYLLKYFLEEDPPLLHTLLNKHRTGCLLQCHLPLFSVRRKPSAAPYKIQSVIHPETELKGPPSHIFHHFKVDL